MPDGRVQDRWRLSASLVGLVALVVASAVASWTPRWLGNWAPLISLLVGFAVIVALTILLVPRRRPAYPRRLIRRG